MNTRTTQYRVDTGFGIFEPFRFVNLPPEHHRENFLWESDSY